jgi:hypothetical protein
MRRKKTEEVSAPVEPKEEMESTVSAFVPPPIKEPKAEKSTGPNVRGIRVSEYASTRASGDRVIEMAGFERWCQENGHGAKKLLNEGWDELLETYRTSEV